MNPCGREKLSFYWLFACCHSCNLLFPFAGFGTWGKKKGGCEWTHCLPWADEGPPVTTSALLYCESLVKGAWECCMSAVRGKERELEPFYLPQWLLSPCSYDSETAWRVAKLHFAQNSWADFPLTCTCCFSSCEKQAVCVKQAVVLVLLCYFMSWCEKTVLIIILFLLVKTTDNFSYLPKSLCFALLVWTRWRRLD